MVLYTKCTKSNPYLCVYLCMLFIHKALQYVKVYGTIDIDKKSVFI